MRQTIKTADGTTQQVLNANLKLYSGDVVDVVVVQSSGSAQGVNLNQLESIFAGYKVYWANALTFLISQENLLLNLQTLIITD